jgi:hypothetical protein
MEHLLDALWWRKAQGDQMTPLAVGLPAEVLGESRGAERRSA